MTRSICIIGARGYVAEELIKLVLKHDDLTIKYVGSRGNAGQLVDEILPSLAGKGIKFDHISPENVTDYPADLYVLAVPNGVAADYADALKDMDCGIIDLSYDHRFDENWDYGLTEKNRQALQGSKKVSNPGCYATGAQFGLLPIIDQLAASPVVFGVSGYSGAGRTPSDKNNPDRLKENFLPYALTGHGHEAEISHHLGYEVSFIPHVAPHFRGISLTIQFALKTPSSAEELLALYQDYYADEPLIKVQTDIPEVSSTADSAAVKIGGFKMDTRTATKGIIIVTLDNLMKGAASQALQNINLMLGLPELKGINPEPKGMNDG